MAEAPSPDHEDAWEASGCPLCESPVSSARRVHQFARASYHRCGECGLVYLSPRPSEVAMLARYRDGAYYEGERSFGYEDYLSDAGAYRRTFARRLRELRPFRASGRLLDVGCGPGLFLEEASRAGYDVRGVDPSRSAVGSAPSHLRGRIEVGTLPSAGFPAESFDVVTMFDVFEHVYHPTEFAAEVARVLAPGGIAAVATPDYDSWLRRVLGSRNVSFKIPEHVSYYTRATLARAVGARFRILETWQIGQYCTTEFVCSRLEGVSPHLARAARTAVRALRLERWTPYVPSGSLLAVLERRE